MCLGGAFHLISTCIFSSAPTSGELSRGKLTNNRMFSVTIPSLHREKVEVFIILQSMENEPDTSMA